jgi:hypothetical protein
MARRRNPEMLYPTLDDALAAAAEALEEAQTYAHAENLRAANRHIQRALESVAEAHGASSGLPSHLRSLLGDY